MPYNTVITFVAYDTLAAADLNNNFANLDYLNNKINSQIIVGAASMQPRDASGSTPNEIIISHTVFNVMDFADGATTFAFFGLVMPSDYNGGTVTARFHWTANSTSTNAVVWNCQAGCVADDESLDMTFGTSQTLTDANKSSAYDLNITDPTPAITIAGTPAAGKYVVFAISRSGTNVSDTLAATASLLFVIIDYTRS